MIPVPPPAWLGLLAACAPSGEIQWDGGRAPLRTAFWQERPSEAGLHVVLALSTSSFPCTLEIYGDDPAVVAENQNELLSDACREGARHLVVDLWRTDGAVAGTYPGLTGGDGADLAVVSRFSTTGWYAVEEAGVQFIDGINRSYAPTEDGFVSEPRGGDGGEVAIDARGEALEGELWVPEVGVSATFDTEECPAGPTLQDDLFDLLSLLEAVC